MRRAKTHPLGAALLLIGQQNIEGQRLRKWILVLSAGDITAPISVQLPDAALTSCPTAAIRAAPMSAAVRSTVPVDEQLTQVPFRVGEIGAGGQAPAR